MKKSLVLSLLLANGAFGIPLSSITWQTPQSIVGDSDVKTNGSLLYAYNVGAAGVSGTTVNGVAFLAYAFPTNFAASTVTVGSVSMTEIPGRYLLSSNTLGGSSTPFSSLSSGYQTLLGSGGSSDYSNAITVVLGGLTSGQQYLVQWWTNNSENGVINAAGLNNTTATSGVNSVTLDANTTDYSGGLGQYVTGTFTASGTSQSLSLATTNVNDAPLINAFQVRAVPEPSSLALIAASCGAVVLRRRRK